MNCKNTYLAIKQTLKNTKNIHKIKMTHISQKMTLTEKLKKELTYIEINNIIQENIEMSSKK